MNQDKKTNEFTIETDIQKLPAAALLDLLNTALFNWISESDQDKQKSSGHKAIMLSLKILKIEQTKIGEELSEKYDMISNMIADSSLNFEEILSEKQTIEINKLQDDILTDLIMILYEKGYVADVFAKREIISSTEGIRDAASPSTTTNSMLQEQIKKKKIEEEKNAVSDRENS